MAVRWCRGGVNVSVRDPAAGQLALWIRDVAITQTA
jgi:hypothetical protein